jgi:hypothetical protein
VKALKVIIGSGAMLMMLGRACLKNADNLRHIPMPVNQLDNTVRYLDDVPTTRPTHTYILPEEIARPQPNASYRPSVGELQDVIELQEVIIEAEGDSMDLDE